MKATRMAGIGVIVLGVFVFIFDRLCAITGYAESTTDNKVLIVSCFIVGIVLVLIREKKPKKANPNQANIVPSIKAYHMEGLPATGNEECVISAENENLSIKTQNQMYNISYEKIYNAIFSTEKEKIIYGMKTKHSPSIGGAVVGGLMLGGVGAVIGAGAGKSKTKVQTYEKVTPFFLINFKSENNEDKSILFSGEKYLNSIRYNPIMRYNQFQQEVNRRIPKEKTADVSIKLEVNNGISMFCSKCGKKLNEDAKFCDICGNPVIQQTINNE